MSQEEKRERLRQLIEQNCLQSDTSITLSGGSSSSFYFDCKGATLDGEALSLMSEQFLELFDQFSERPTAIGGLTMGADFMAAGVIVKAYEIGHPLLHGSIVRKEPKKHGTRNRIEHQLPAGTKIVVVDDVITSGGSIRQACEEYLREGYVIVGLAALVDRKAGGKESLEKDFGPVLSLFTKDDFNINS